MPKRSVNTTLAFLAAIATSQFGCDALGPDDRVLLRVHNEGTVTFDRLTIYTPDGPMSFGDLAGAERTPYFSVSRAYQTATTEVVAGSDTLRLQVIDHVGDPELDPGRYTFLIRVVYEGSQGRVEQTLRRD